MRQNTTLLIAGIVTAATGAIWLVLATSYGAPPRATLIPVEENSATTTNTDNGSQSSISKNFPTIDRKEAIELTKDAVKNDAYGIRVEFVKSYKGYFTGGIAPVNSEGEGPAHEANAVLLSSTKEDVFHHRILICGPDGICIDDSQGSGPIFANTDETSNNSTANAPEQQPKEDYQTIFYQFYPLNEVGWNLGDVVNIWILISNAAKDGSPIGESQWVSLGEVTIAQCNSLEWCPNQYG